MSVGETAHETAEYGPLSVRGSFTDFPKDILRTDVVGQTLSLHRPCVRIDAHRQSTYRYLSPW